MPFKGHIGDKTYEKLALIASEGEVLAIPRRLRTKGMDQLVAANLPKDDDNDLQEFSVQLLALGDIERLPSGEVPVVTYLRNIALQLKLRGRSDKAEPFERAASAIGNKENGVPELPDPATLPEVKNEVIIGLDDMVDFSFFAAGQTVGKSVARILVPRFDNGVPTKLPNEDAWIMSGTAWLVGEALALTNNHVINARKQGEAAASDDDFNLQASKSKLQFDYDNATQPPVEVSVVGVLSTSKMNELDYALLRLEKKVGRPALRFYSDALVVDDTKRAALNIIQHPRGETKRVAFRNNLVTFADQNTVRYFTDTDYGSSGSPVCDDYWRVVALHRGALPANNVQFMGRKQAYVNYGSQISAVMNHIKTLNDGALAEILSDQV